MGWHSLRIAHPNDSGVGALERRPRHDEGYGCRRRGLPVDDWFDTIEAGVMAHARGFIEGMLEEELAGALSCPRCGWR